MVTIPSKYVGKIDLQCCVVGSFYFYAQYKTDHTGQFFGVYSTQYFLHRFSGLKLKNYTG